MTEKMRENNGKEDEQNKHLLGGYYDQKYQHFGFGGPKKEENIVKENEKLNGNKEKETEEFEKVEEGNEEDNGLEFIGELKKYFFRRGSFIYSNS